MNHLVDGAGQEGASAAFRPGATYPSGTRFGRYRIRRHLANGGMAQVYLADMLHSDDTPLRPVAMKLIHSHLAQDAGFLRKFEYEARLSGRLIHENIVQLLDYDNGQGQPFLVMEYVEGATLDRLVSWHHRSRRSLPLATLLSLLEQLLQGLAFAHDLDDPITGRPLHVLHRDLKPSNILINRRGVAKITDFGIARATDRPFETDAGILHGTASYMAPEQLKGAREQGPPLDLWAVGVMLYEMIARQPLFGGSLAEIISAIVLEDLPPRLEALEGIPPELRAVLCRLLAQTVDARYQSARQVLSDLAPLRHQVGADTADWVELFEEMSSGDVTAAGMRLAPSEPGFGSSRVLLSSDGAGTAPPGPSEPLLQDEDVSDAPTTPYLVSAVSRMTSLAGERRPERIRTALERDLDSPPSAPEDWRSTPDLEAEGTGSEIDAEDSPPASWAAPEIVISSHSDADHEPEPLERASERRPSTREDGPAFSHLERRPRPGRFPSVFAATLVGVGGVLALVGLWYSSPGASTRAEPTIPPPTAVSGVSISEPPLEPAPASARSSGGSNPPRATGGRRSATSTRTQTAPLEPPVPSDPTAAVTQSPPHPPGEEPSLPGVLPQPSSGGILPPPPDVRSLIEVRPLAPAPAAARLNVSSRPAAAYVTIDGEKVDASALQDHEIPAGRHRISLVPTSRVHQPVSFDVNLAPGESCVRVFDFNARDWIVRE